MRSRAVMLFALCACGPVVSPEDGDTTSSDVTTSVDASTATMTASDPSDPTSQSGSGNPSTSSTTVDPSDPTIADSTDSGGCGIFVQCFDAPPESCDPWADDCIRGEKCMPYANDGSSYWNATRCSPIADAPREVGDSCTVVSDSVMGEDDCAAGAMCLYVDPSTNMGVCVAHCMGTAEEPFCEDPSTTCVREFAGVFDYCLPACDPILQDCALGGCYIAQGQAFACGPTIGIGLPGDVCFHHWDCFAGSICVAAEDLVFCPGESCCASMCDTTEPEPCSVEQACEPLFPDDQSPFGICTGGE